MSITTDPSARTRRVNRAPARVLTAVGAVLALVAAGSGGTAAAATTSLPASHAVDLNASVAKHAAAGFSLRALPYPAFGPIQAFGFDQLNRELFVVQNYTPHVHGKVVYTDTLTINRVSLASGKVLDHMTVGKAGHGAIGVVPVRRGVTRIWLEGRRSAKQAHSSSAELFGTELDAFDYKADRSTPGHALPATPAGLTRHFVNGTHLSATTDPVHQRLAVRYYNAKLKAYRVAVYHWTKVSGTALTYVTLPPMTDLFAQGFALYGHYYYVLSGQSASRTSIAELDLNRVVKGAAVRTRTVATKAFAHTLSGYVAEPEGIATYLGADKRFGLFFGFGTHASAKHPTSTVTIACKIGLTPHVNRAQPSTCPR